MTDSGPIYSVFGIVTSYMSFWTCFGNGREALAGMQCRCVAINIRWLGCLGFASVIGDVRLGVFNHRWSHACQCLENSIQTGSATVRFCGRRSDLEWRWMNLQACAELARYAEASLEQISNQFVARTCQLLASATQ